MFSNVYYHRIEFMLMQTIWILMEMDGRFMREANESSVIDIA